MRSSRGYSIGQRIATAGFLAVLALGLPFSPAYALKVQQADQSELSQELLAGLSGLEEKTELDPQAKVGLINYAKRIQQLGGEPRAFLLTALLMPFPLDPETYLDLTPGQRALVKRKIPFQFGPGLLYHGRGDLDDVIRTGQLPGGISLTRVAHQWATGDFHRESSSPAIVVIPTSLFNHYLKKGRATLKQMGHDIVEPYPTIDEPIQIAELVTGGGSFWVSEDTYERYQRILRGREPADPALRDNLRPVMKTGAMTPIPGLRHLALDRGADPDVEFTAVSHHVLTHNLLVQIPLLEPFKPTAGLEEGPVGVIVLPEVAGMARAVQHRLPRGQALAQIDAVLTQLPGGPITLKELVYHTGLSRHQLDRYRYKARIRRENRRRRLANHPALELMRSDALTVRDHDAAIRRFLHRHPGGVLLRRELAEAVFLSEAQLKHYHPARRVRADNRQRLREAPARPAIVYGAPGLIQWTRTEQTLRGTVRALPGGVVGFQTLVRKTGLSPATLKRHRYRRVVQQENERRVHAGLPLLRLRTQQDARREFGQRNRARYQEIDDAIRNALSVHPDGRLRLNALRETLGISSRTLWAHQWRMKVAQENARRLAVKPGRPLIVPPRPRGSTEGLLRRAVQPAAGMEEGPVGVLVLPEVAGMAAVVPAGRPLRVLLWEGQVPPTGVREEAVARLTVPEEAFKKTPMVRDRLLQEAWALQRQGIRRLVVVHPQWISAAHHLASGVDGLEVVNIAVSPSTVETSLTRLAEELGAAFDLAEMTRRVRQGLEESQTYGRMQ